MSIAIETLEIPAQANSIREQALTVLPQVLAIQVMDEPSKEVANGWYTTINEALAQIGQVFDPLIEAAMEAKRKTEASRKAIVTTKESFEAPWMQAKGYIIRQLAGYKQLMDAKRAKEEELLRQAAIKEEMERRKREEDERFAQAAELEKAGATDEAQAMLEETLEQAKEPVKVYVQPPTTPKVEVSGGTFRTTWSARVVNLKALCLAVGTGKAALNLVEANMPALNKMAIALHEQMNVPGVEAISDVGMAKGRR